MAKFFTFHLFAVRIISVRFYLKNHTEESLPSQESMIKLNQKI